jgi:hypothetical protein
MGYAGVESAAGVLGPPRLHADVAHVNGIDSWCTALFNSILPTEEPARSRRQNGAVWLLPRLLLLELPSCLLWLHRSAHAADPLCSPCALITVPGHILRQPPGFGSSKRGPSLVEISRR